MTDPPGATDPAQNPKFADDSSNERKPGGCPAGAVTSQRPLLETDVPVAGLPVRRAQVGRKFKTEPSGRVRQETMALLLVARRERNAASRFALTAVAP